MYWTDSNLDEGTGDASDQRSDSDEIEGEAGPSSASTQPTPVVGER